MSEGKRERRLIPAHELQGGASVYVERHHAACALPRQAKARPEGIDVMVSDGGAWVTVSDLIMGYVKRGDLIAYDDAPGTPQSNEEIVALRREILRANKKAAADAEDAVAKAALSAIDLALGVKKREG